MSGSLKSRGLVKNRRLTRLLIVAGAGVVAAVILAGVVYFGQEEIRVVKTRHDNGADKEVWLYRRDMLGRQEKVKEFVYFENGNKESEVDYKHGKVNGWARMWYETGQLFLEATYRDSKAHGVRRAYHKNGQLFCRAEFEDGTLLRRENWDEEGNEIYLDMDRPPPF